eukprot:4052819-Amphidinium_carterae.1
MAGSRRLYAESNTCTQWGARIHSFTRGPYEHPSSKRHHQDSQQGPQRCWHSWPNDHSWRCWRNFLGVPV